MSEARKPSAKGVALNLALWLAQLAVAGPFVFGGFVKLTTPIAELAKVMSWTADYALLARFTGVVDILGGVGLILPALTRIRPGLTVTAAYGCMALQVLAMAFHLSRGETFVIPMNLGFLALAAFVAWGRSKAVPMAARAARKA